MAICAAEHHARKVGLGGTGDTASTGGVITQGVNKLLQGCGAGNYIVWVRDVGPFGVNEKRLEGTHTKFLQLIIGKRLRRLGDGKWETRGAEVVPEAVVTQSKRIYIELRQETVAQWVVLRPLFDVCARETGYKGGRRRRGAWCRQEAT